MSRAARRRLEFYLAIAPWLLGLLFFTGGPILASVYFSFTDWNVLSAPRWVGIANYVQLFTVDPIFWTSLYNTAFYTVGHVPLTFLVALLAALLLNQPVPLIPFFRTVYYLPTVTAGVAVSILWLWIFNPEFGLANALIRAVGGKDQLWFADPDLAKLTFVIISLWGFGEAMIIFLAGLQGIPETLYEAARIDGAGRWGAFRHVTLPLLSPVIFFVVITGFIAGFQVFTSAYVATAGGPANSTRFFVLHLYDTAFSYFRMGYASAMAWLLFTIVLLFTLVQFALARRLVYYEDAR